MSEWPNGVASRLIQEFALLRPRWWSVLLCLVFQYIHGVFTQLAARVHEPLPTPLHDLGFQLIPELPASARWITEALFTSSLLTFIAWTFSPLFAAQRHFSVAVLWSRLLVVIVACQALRILSFSATQLPGPALHCRYGEPTATRPWPAHWWGHAVVDVRRQVAHSCGDLIFSSHMTFVLTAILGYCQYGSVAAAKGAAWTVGAALSLLIISARKHYTVDVVVAWYTVPLVFAALHQAWGVPLQLGGGGGGGGGRRGPAGAVAAGVVSGWPLSSAAARQAIEAELPLCKHRSQDLEQGGG